MCLSNDQLRWREYVEYDERVNKRSDLGVSIKSQGPYMIYRKVYN